MPPWEFVLLSEPRIFLSPCQKFPRFKEKKKKKDAKGRSLGEPDLAALVGRAPAACQCVSGGQWSELHSFGRRARCKICARFARRQLGWQIGQALFLLCLPFALSPGESERVFARLARDFLVGRKQVSLSSGALAADQPSGGPHAKAT